MNLPNFLTTHSHHLQATLFIVMFILIWNIENITGLLFNYQKWKHSFVNAPFSLTNIPGQVLLGALFLIVTIWTSKHLFGIIYLLPFQNKILLLSTSFILLDLGEYVYHVLMHKIKRLWMFHVVHHSDNVVDVSTTLREHPGENIIRLSFTLIWMFLTGSALWMLVVRQVIQIFTTLFAHMNYRLPEKTDNILGWFIITPNLHQVHHHHKQPYTDCNYGDVLSIWDRVFGTLKKLPAEQLQFGVDTFPEERYTESFKALLLLPFGKYRKSPNQSGNPDANQQI